MGGYEPAPDDLATLKELAQANRVPESTLWVLLRDLPRYRVAGKGKASHFVRADAERIIRTPRPVPRPAARPKEAAAA